MSRGESPNHAPRSGVPHVDVQNVDLSRPGAADTRDDLPAHIREHAPIDAEYGVVREVERTRTSFRLGVEITAPGVCDRCVVKDNCYGAGSIVWAEADAEIQVGRQVRLAMRRGTVLKATAWVYGIPLLAVVAGVVTGHQWLFASRAEEPRVLLSFGLGVGLMLAAGFVLSRLNDWIARRVTIHASAI